jgi:serine protease AprX
MTSGRKLGVFIGMCAWALGPLVSNDLLAQTAPDRYWVQFEGKLTEELPEGFITPYQLDHPEEFLSAKSLERRERQGIDVTRHDVPTPPSYIAALRDISSVKVILQSKWFNAATVALVDSTFEIEDLLDLPMVTEIKRVAQIENPRPIDWEEAIATRNESTADTLHYGKGWNALTQLNAQWLHGLGFDGDGMTIAVLDAGYEHVESLPIFEKAWQEERILEGIDAMKSQGGLFAHHRHGTSVLGTMAGHLNDSLIGTAPGATYVLYRTEDAYSEYLIEEDYWISAAEHADSSGVDLMNTSLGYSLFDDSTMNHTADDLNGITARISQAAAWAADKGILCVTSAGNSGSSPWHFITAPADADGILTVGAVNAAGEHAAFSGWGPTADGRIKPDVMALGVQAAYPHADSTIRRGNGTSFSSPILCGAAACLWQAFPEKSAAEIRRAILESAHLFHQPNDSMGYGIPNFQRAFELLDTGGAADWSGSKESLLIFPNPSEAGIIRWQYQSDNHNAHAPNGWKLFDMRGRAVLEGNLHQWTTFDGIYQGWIDVSAPLRTGQYLFQLAHDEQPLANTSWVYAPR